MPQPIRVEVQFAYLLPKGMMGKTKSSFEVLKEEAGRYLLRMPEGVGHKFASEEDAWWVAKRGCRVVLESKVA